jgi:hypothetical protein
MGTVDTSLAASKLDSACKTKYSRGGSEFYFGTPQATNDLAIALLSQSSARTNVYESGDLDVLFTLRGFKTRVPPENKAFLGLNESFGSRPVAWCRSASDGAGCRSGHRGAQTRRVHQDDDERSHRDGRDEEDDVRAGRWLPARGRGARFPARVAFLGCAAVDGGGGGRAGRRRSRGAGAGSRG